MHGLTHIVGCGWNGTRWWLTEGAAVDKTEVDQQVLWPAGRRERATKTARRASRSARRYTGGWAWGVWSLGVFSVSIVFTAPRELV